MIGDIITIEQNEAYLRQVSLPVNFQEMNLEEIRILEEYCKQNDVLAMASIQLGIPKRIIYLKNTRLDMIRNFQNGEETEEALHYNEARILINPVIIKKEGLTDYWEACASCGDYMGHVYRPYRIIVEYFGVGGEKHTDTFEGFESTVLSHEMDHLDGILHMDQSTEILKMPPEERKIWRQTHDYCITSKEGCYEELIKNKKIR